jgi:SAM-dependent methyltransferase
MTRMPCGAELVRRYKANYGIAERALVTEEMVHYHWTLERQLTSELLSSDPEHRWKAFERCYTRLYSELTWLNELIGMVGHESSAADAALWAKLIGPPPKRIYEIGSGKGRLIASLAERKYDCTATEITRERGEKWVPPHVSVRWAVSDGVHLDRFEPLAFYDAVISDQVIEHLHPDDLGEHFRGVHAILRSGGRYAFTTPHAFEGPFDVSRVFGLDRPAGMHLKEYTYRELNTSLRDAGFTRIEASWWLPRRLRARIGDGLRPIPSRVYLTYLRAVERSIAPLSQHPRRLVARALRVAFWTPGMALVAIKSR